MTNDPGGMSRLISDKFMLDGATFGRNQADVLCDLHASQALTQSARSISVTSVLRLSWSRRTQSHYGHEEKLVR